MLGLEERVPRASTIAPDVDDQRSDRRHHVHARPRACKRHSARLSSTDSSSPYRLRSRPGAIRRIDCRYDESTCDGGGNVCHLSRTECGSYERGDGRSRRSVAFADTAD